MRPFFKRCRNEQIACLLCDVRDVRGAWGAECGMRRRAGCVGRTGHAGCVGARDAHGQPRRASDALDVQVKCTSQTRGNLNIALMREVMFLVYPEHVQEFLVIWF